jgi:hypothetical protein
MNSGDTHLVSGSHFERSCGKGESPGMFLPHAIARVFVEIRSQLSEPVKDRLQAAGGNKFGRSTTQRDQQR